MGTSLMTRQVLRMNEYMLYVHVNECGVCPTSFIPDQLSVESKNISDALRTFLVKTINNNNNNEQHASF